MFTDLPLTFYCTFFFPPYLVLFRLHYSFELKEVFSTSKMAISTKMVKGEPRERTIIINQCLHMDYGVELELKCCWYNDNENCLSNDRIQAKSGDFFLLFCTIFYISVLEESLSNLLTALEIEQQKNRSVLP